MIVSIPEVLITSSILILALIGLRAVLRGRIHPRVQYALWALVLVRLLLPVSWSSPLSVMNAVERAPAAVEQLHQAVPAAPETLPQTTPAQNGILAESAPAAPAAQNPAPQGAAPAAETTPENETVPPQTVQQTAPAPGVQIVLLALWAIPAAAMGVWLIACNARFGRALRRTREPFDAAPYGVSLPVYTAPGLPSPCLFGLVRPAIYLPADCPSSENDLRHILTHEQMHFHQGDHLWSALRGLCLCLYWFDPLVWAAAVLSRRDCELACDARAIAALGEGERIGYGRTLLSLMGRKSAPADLLCTATTMSGSQKSRRERIAFIARRRPWKAATAALAALLALLCAACTFTGASSRNQTLYESGGLTFAIPKEYQDELLVVTPAPDVVGDTPLLEVYDKATWEAYAQEEDTPDSGDMGWLFSIVSADQASYESHLAGDGSGADYFARSGETYYVLWFPTDVRIPDQERAARYSGLTTTVTSDALRRNGLSEVDASEFFARPYTYDSAHATVEYAPYGPSDERRWTLTLSRPATDGPGGIWCVERWSDGVNTYATFPVQTAGICARNYYAQVQMNCDADAAAYAEWSTPQVAALNWLRDNVGLEAAAENVTDVTMVPAPETEAPGNAMRRKAVQDMIATLLDAGFDAAQCREFTLIATTPAASYSGIDENGPVQLWCAEFSIPNGLSVPEDFLPRAYEEQPTACLGWYLHTGNSWTLLRAADYPGLEAPPYAAVCNAYLAGSTAPDLYTVEDVTIALPAQYAPEVTVEAGSGGTLLTVHQKSAYADTAEAGPFLFSIERLSPARFEQDYLAADHSGQTAFARDSTGNYYLFCTATDVQWTGSDGSRFIHLRQTLRTFVCADMMERNGLTAYSDSAFFDRQYTYDGTHIAYLYDPTGDWRDQYTLILSQPARQGEGGIWCVERVHHGGNLYYVFPQSDADAQTYYENLQASVDGGHRPGTLDPEQVALEYLSGWQGLTPAAADLQETDLP